MDLMPSFFGAVTGGTLSKSITNFLTFEKAKEQKFVIDFDSVPPVTAPKKLVITSIESVSLEDIVPYIDWVIQCTIQQ